MGPLLVALSSLLHGRYKHDMTVPVLKQHLLNTVGVCLTSYSSKIDLGSNPVEMMAVRGLDGCLNFRVDKPPPPFGRSPT